MGDQACGLGPQEPGCTMRGSVKNQADGNKLNHAVSFENNGGAIYTLVLEQPSKTCTVVAEIGELFTINYKTTGEPTNWSFNCPTLSRQPLSARTSLSLLWTQLLHSRPTVRLLSPTITLLLMPRSGLTDGSTN